jgi:heterodisulfide reductase subunit A2
MNTVKSTLVLKEHYPDIEVKVFYIDIRAFGKGFEDLYTRSRRLGVHYLRGLPGSWRNCPTAACGWRWKTRPPARLEFHDLDMLVLALGIKPAAGTQRLQEMLGLQLTPDGFFLEAHPKLQPVDAATRGFYAGCAEGPKDIKESVTQASAAAGRAIRLMHKGEITTEPITSEVMAEQCKACGKVRRGLPVQRHHRGYQEEDPGGGQHGGLRRLRHLRRRMPPSAPSS